MYRPRPENGDRCRSTTSGFMNIPTELPPPAHPNDDRGDQTRIASCRLSSPDNVPDSCPDLTGAQWCRSSVWSSQSVPIHLFSPSSGAPISPLLPFPPLPLIPLPEQPRWQSSASRRGTAAGILRKAGQRRCSKRRFPEEQMVPTMSHRVCVLLDSFSIEICF